LCCESGKARSGDNRLSGITISNIPAQAERSPKKSGHACDAVCRATSFVAILAKRDGIAARALEMLILTSTRTGSLIGLKDRELDLKMAALDHSRQAHENGKEFVVPLCYRALHILRTIPREARQSASVYGQQRGSHISNMTMLN